MSSIRRFEPEIRLAKSELFSLSLFPLFPRSLSPLSDLILRLPLSDPLRDPLQVSPTFLVASLLFSPSLNSENLISTSRRHKAHEKKMDRVFALQERSRKARGRCSSGCELTGSSKEPNNSREKCGTTASRLSTARSGKRSNSG